MPPAVNADVKSVSRTTAAPSMQIPFLVARGRAPSEKRVGVSTRPPAPIKPAGSETAQRPPSGDGGRDLKYAQRACLSVSSHPLKESRGIGSLTISPFLRNPVSSIFERSANDHSLRPVSCGVRSGGVGNWGG